MAASINQAVYFALESPDKRFRVLKTAFSERMKSWSRRFSYSFLILPPVIGIALLWTDVSDNLPPSAIGIQIFFHGVFSLVIFWKVRVLIPQIDNLTYALESGFLVARLDDSRELFRTDLSRVSKVEIGNDGSPEAMQMRLVSKWKLTVGVPTLENMEKFVAGVAAQVPVEIERRSTPLPIWTKQAIAVGAFSLLFFMLLFAGLGYALVQSY